MEKELTLEQIHNQTLVIIKKIEEICVLLHIHYVVWYGSLIGTIRHQGFIPWDDDFDIAMLRPDYDVFVSYCRDNKQDLLPFFLMDKENTTSYPFNIARFCDMRYKLELSEYPDVEMGLFVDIYPLDPVGNNADKARKQIQWRKKIYSIGLTSTVKKRIPDTKKGLITKAIKTIIYIWAKNKTPSYFFNKLDSLAAYYDYDKSSLVSIVVWEMDYFSFPKAWIEDTIDAPFESIVVRVPREYDKILKQIYGDYMSPPPKELQCPTHSYKLYKKNPNDDS